MKKLNDRLADFVTSAVATMTCAYLFAALAIYGFPYHDLSPHSIVQWVSQEFLQLVLLSVIMVGQRVHAERINELHKKIDKKK